MRVVSKFINTCASAQPIAKQGAAQGQENNRSHSSLIKIDHNQCVCGGSSTTNTKHKKKTVKRATKGHERSMQRKSQQTANGARSAVLEAKINYQYVWHFYWRYAINYPKLFASVPFSRVCRLVREFVSLLGDRIEMCATRLRFCIETKPEFCCDKK